MFNFHFYLVDYVAPPPYVFETQLVNKRFYENPQPSIEEPKPDIFIRYLDKDNREYFTAHSVKEDGSVTPKYYIYVPSLIKEKGCVFSDASCNGVFHFQNWKGDHHLWSPTTNELKTLPKSLDMLPGVLRKFQRAFGMCYDHRCEDYKVLQVVSNHTEESGIFETVFHFELYSLKSNSWKIIQCKGFSGIGRFSGACINGVFYTPAISLEKEAKVILSFDFSTETLSTLPVPPDTRSPYVVHSVFEYNGMLSVLVYSPDETVPSSYELWIMNKKGLWVNACVFSTCGIQSPVCFSKNGGQLYFESMNDELLVFDRATRKLKQLGIYCFSNRIKFHPVVERSFHLNLNGVSKVEVTQMEFNKQEVEKKEGCTIEANDRQRILVGAFISGEVC